MENPLDRPLKDVITHTIVADLMGDDAFIRDPVDFARRAALDGFRQGVALADKIVAEMAADHEHAGESEKAEVLCEAGEAGGCSQPDLPALPTTPILSP